jgi:hypothetical protein
MVKTEGKDRALVIKPPANPPECCTREVLTMDVTEEWRESKRATTPQR